MKSEQNRPLAVLVNGPRHLFNAVGAYYAFELARHFDVILIVPENCADLPAIKKLSELPAIREVVYLPERQNNAAFHLTAYRVAQRISKLAPTLLLQHSDCYPHNFYFSQMMPVSCVQGSFANGVTLNQDIDFDYIRRNRIAAFARRLRLPLNIATAFYRLREGWNDKWHHSIIPFFLTGRVFQPPQNTITGGSGRAAPRSRFRMMYTQREIEWQRKAVPNEKLVLVQPPLKTVGPEFHAYLELPERQSGIALLPTWGVLDLLAAQIGSAEAQRSMFEIWRDTLLALRERLGPLPMRVKLHPAAASDPRAHQIMEQLAQAIDGLIVVAPSISAETVILSSSCVVGDFSSVLWWTYQLGGRTIVSVDPWLLPGADEMRYYPGIVYVRTPAEIAHADLRPPARSHNHAPTVTQFLQDQTTGKTFGRDDP